MYPLLPMNPLSMMKRSMPSTGLLIILIVKYLPFDEVLSFVLEWAFLTYLISYPKRVELWAN